MQALEKIFINTDWITILLVLLLGTIFFLKGLDAVKLKGYVFALFNKGFVENEVEENSTFPKAFQILMFLFSITVLSLVCYYCLIYFSETKIDGFYLFGITFLTVFFYFLIKRSLEYLLSLLFLIRKEVRFFLVSKSSYLYNISFYLFVSLVLLQYTKLNITFLTTFTTLLFLMRFIFHIINNKNLIFNKLFYFILYICAFEIAPLFILFKLMF
ncbi:DUF4271 domain-containing protein [Polaribacter pectinis]|uniref:DUF4271 domain-containing protein n=1 Tax=Polaribacter pectinis TaxID=2738844 RepID=A0A7G9L851_9FLAO|nr:DUF4271 domain-containing protein [Polaribacter pectinis]QNM84800.1 DUF4271 domain-containing protein [Polaribacter pectinis]